MPYIFRFSRYLKHNDLQRAKNCLPEKRISRSFGGRLCTDLHGKSMPALKKVVCRCFSAK